MIYSTPEEIAADLAYWQKALRLQDWTVNVVIKPKQTLVQKAGDISMCSSKKIAYVQLLDPQDWSTEEEAFEGKQDHEQTLVHEFVAPSHAADRSGLRSCDRRQ